MHPIYRFLIVTVVVVVVMIIIYFAFFRKKNKQSTDSKSTDSKSDLDLSLPWNFNTLETMSNMYTLNSKYKIYNSKIQTIDVPVFYINLDRSQSRKQFMEKQFEDFNINYSRVKWDRDWETLFPMC